MPPRAVLFGSIGVLAETANLQRQAFDRAFGEAGLTWPWDDEDGRALLNQPGGAPRISAHVRHIGATVDAVAICGRKEQIFQSLLRQRPLPRRPGVDAVIEAARAAGVQIALATSADRGTVEAVLSSTGLSPQVFAFVADRGMVGDPKPASDIYLATLSALGVSNAEAIAIEDTPECAEAAIAAGIACVAFPGSLHVGRRFGDVAAQVQVLAPRLFGLSEVAPLGTAPG